MNGETDFEKIQNAFYAEWKGKSIERGSGYKQFKRWEHRMLPRLINGKLPDKANAYFVKEQESKRISHARLDGDEWTSLGPTSWTNGPNGYNPGMGRINCIDAHPADPNTLFVGTPGGGLWKSTDAGVNWHPVFEDLSVLGVTDFYIDPQNTDKYYLLTGDGYGGDTNSLGMFISTDAGATWSQSGLTHDVSAYAKNYRMIVSPTDSDFILIAGNNGVQKSTDGGTSWSTVLNGTVTDVEFKPGDPATVYACTNSGSFFRSTDSGDSWSTILGSNGELGRTAIGVSEANASYVYMLASSSAGLFGGVYKSTDSGESMTLQSDSPNIFGYSLQADDERGQGWYDLSIAVNPSDAEDIYVSGIHIWNSKDGGQSWQDEDDNYQVLNYWVYDESNPGNYVHADNHTLDFLNGDLYAGCDGGIWKTSNLGGSWTDLSATLNNTQFYRLGLDPNDEDRIVAGAQDNGSNLRTSDGWIHLFGADGMEAAIDHTDGNRVYTSYQFGGVIRYYNNFVESYIASELLNDGESGGWITPFVIDPTNSSTIYLGLTDLWKSTDQGDNWTKISNFGSTETQLHVSVSEVDTDYIYVTTGWNLYRTKNGGTTWEAINAGLPSEYNKYITVSEDDPETLWATFSGYSSGQKVYESTNAGSTWTNISDGLPNIPANTIVHLKGSDNQLFVGTDVGVYQREGSSDWAPWFDGLPNVEVSELEIHYASGKLRAATYGRGIWEREVPLENRLVINSITASAEEIVEDETVSFSSSYDGTPESVLWTFEGGTPETSADENPKITYEEPGEFDVTLQIFGFNTPSLTLENHILVQDRVEITGLYASYETINQFGEVVFDVRNDGEIDTRSWTFEGGTPETSSEEFPRITYNQKGVYDVTVEITGFNSDTQVFEDMITVLDPLHVETSQAAIKPTVTNEFIEIEISEPGSTLLVYDVMGKVVLTKANLSQGSMKVDFSTLESGLYSLTLQSASGVEVAKIIKK